MLIEAQTAGLRCFTSKSVVPKEVDVTGLVDFIQLSENASQWAEKIIKSNLFERENQFEAVKKAGYESESNVQFLEQNYLSMIK